MRGFSPTFRPEGLLVEEAFAFLHGVRDVKERSEERFLGRPPVPRVSGWGLAGGVPTSAERDFGHLVDPVQEESFPGPSGTHGTPAGISRRNNLIFRLFYPSDPECPIGNPISHQKPTGSQ